jgi:hypothetical protein
LRYYHAAVSSGRLTQALGLFSFFLQVTAAQASSLRFAPIASARFVHRCLDTVRSASHVAERSRSRWPAISAALFCRFCKANHRFALSAQATARFAKFSAGKVAWVLSCVSAALYARRMQAPRPNYSLKRTAVTGSRLPKLSAAAAA